MYAPSVYGYMNTVCENVPAIESARAHRNHAVNGMNISGVCVYHAPLLVHMY